MTNLPVTCIIPVRNGAATIERAVKSAFDAGCDYVDIYDDCSTDNIGDVMHGLFNTYRCLTYDCRSPIKRGVNFGRNCLIEDAHEGLIIPLDADDTLCDITPLRDAWQPGTWVYGNHLELQDTGGLVVNGVPAGSLSRKNITGVTFLFHRDDWLKVGGYDPDFAYAEDYGFQCALTNAGVKPVYVDTVVYHRYMHPEGNERSALAGEYWSFYRDMARRKYPNVFTGTG